MKTSYKTLEALFNDEQLSSYSMRYFVMVFISIAIVTVSSVYADCATSTLQYHYDSSDVVFHGTLISAQYDSGKSRPTSWTFAIQESFKGIDSKEAVLRNADKYGDSFKQGQDYLIFAEYNEQQLELHLCNFQYYAFPTIVNMVSHLDEPDNAFGHIREYDLNEYLTEPEKIQLEGLDDTFAKERQKERDRLFGQFMLIGIPASVGIGVVILWIRMLK